MKRLHLERIELVPGECDLGGGVTGEEGEACQATKDYYDSGLSLALTQVLTLALAYHSTLCPLCFYFLKLSFC
jgi:hypothetical protein